MKRFAVGLFILVTAYGCSDSPQAKYDMMTGEKLECHLDNVRMEQRLISSNNFGIRVLRLEIEGHVYYTRGDAASAFTHSAACPCHTNSLNRTID